MGARFTLAQALIILLALLWDLATSGESVTNGHGRTFPRSARVLMYCGYVVLIATVVLFLASDRSAKTTGCSVTVDGGVRDAFPR